MIPFIVLPISRLPDIAEKTACTQMKDDICRYILSTSSPLWNIRKPRYRQNNKGYQILRIRYVTQKTCYYPIGSIKTPRFGKL